MPANTKQDQQPLNPVVGPRFLTIKNVAVELATSDVQIRALLASGDLLGIQIGGRNLWRIERVKLEEYIAGLYQKVPMESPGGEGPEAAETSTDSDSQQ